MVNHQHPSIIAHNGSCVPEGYRESQILHHSTKRVSSTASLTTLQQLLNASSGIDFHSREILKTIDFASFLSELLVEGIAEVVCGISGDEEDAFANFRELDGERA